jgi:hypothetical protein
VLHCALGKVLTEVLAAAHRTQVLGRVVERVSVFVVDVVPSWDWPMELLEHGSM